jgi:hypothetical protein
VVQVAVDGKHEVHGICAEGAEMHLDMLAELAQSRSMLPEWRSAAAGASAFS